MGDENPIRTLGDYSKPSHKGYRNTIELPVGNNMVPLRSDTIRLVQNGCSFHGLWSEDPNQHLKDFLKLMDSLDLDGANRERTRLRFAKPVKAITLPQDVPSTSDRRLIKLENQVQRLMEAHLALTEPTQVNKITTSCKICSGPHDTQYCMEDPEQAFVEYASSRTDEEGGSNKDDEGIKWLDVEEPLDLVDTSHKFTAKAYIDVDLPMNIMSLAYYNSIRKNGYEYSGRNFVRLGRDMHVFIGNMSYVIDFTILENIETNIDPSLSHVIFGRPFIEIACLAINRKHGLMTFTYGTKEIIFKTPYKDPERSGLSSKGYDLLSSRVILSEDDYDRGCRKPSDLEDAFLTEEIHATDDFKDYETVFRNVDVLTNQPQLIVSTQGAHSKRKQKCSEESSSPRKLHKITIRKKKQSTTLIPRLGDDRERDKVAEATILSLTLHKTALAAEAAEAQENVAKVQEKLDEGEIEKMVEGLEPGSHKENPENVTDDDDEIAKEKKDKEIKKEMNIEDVEKMDEIREVPDHCNKVVPETTFAKTNQMIKKEMPRLVNLTVKWIENGAKTGIIGLNLVKFNYFSKPRQSREMSPSIPVERAREYEFNGALGS
ncbi:hypothetical protein Tco_0486490 [Tanacetum coccineum]